MITVLSAFGEANLQDSIINDIDSPLLKKGINQKIKYVYFVNDKMNYPLSYSVNQIDSILTLLPNIEELSIGKISLTKFPMEILKLTKLKNLLIGSCQLTDIPKELFAMSSLNYLDLTDNPIKTLPEISQTNNSL